MTANTSTDPITAPDLFDDWGYLDDPEIWTRDLALRLAAQLGIGELSEDHWRIVDHLREHYLAAGTLPVQKTICHELDLAPTCVVDLFGGPVEAWKIAGLPNPGEEARAYMANMEAEAPSWRHARSSPARRTP